MTDHMTGLKSPGSPTPTSPQGGPHRRGTLKTWGGAKRLVGAGSGGVPAGAAEPDEALLRAIARARRWEAQLAAGERTSADDIAAAEGLQSRYVDKILRLAWMAPALVEGLLDGRRLREAALADLGERGLSTAWGTQKQILHLV